MKKKTDEICIVLSTAEKTMLKKSITNKHFKINVVEPKYNETGILKHHHHQQQQLGTF